MLKGINIANDLKSREDKFNAEMHGPDNIRAVATHLASDFACLKLKHYLQILH
ncbi:hypothetical protein AB6735_26365 [Mucilaginibacter sp. RCC_168]|uniref:hypothetical protein n=1 Tax=Mucilaginibacter sp. RCC_168 TaxID=3239221 RepID=UPI003524F630